MRAAATRATTAREAQRKKGASAPEKGRKHLPGWGGQADKETVGGYRQHGRS